MQNSTKAVDIPLHDIKPLLEIQEYSFYYLVVLVTAVTIVVIGLFFLLYKYLKYRNRFNIRKEHSKLLHSVDLSDAKKAAYDITYYGATFKDDSERMKSAYESLVEKLEAYKYKKYVAEFDEEIRHSLERYIGMIDV